MAQIMILNMNMMFMDFETNNRKNKIIEDPNDCEEEVIVNVE